MGEYTGKLWYDNSKDLHEGMIGLKGTDGNQYQIGHILPDWRDEYGELIAAAVNSCISINPENPLAVAEGMEDAIKALEATDKYFKGCIKAWAAGDRMMPNEEKVVRVSGDTLDKLCDEAAEKVAQALSKIGSK